MMKRRKWPMKGWHKVNENEKHSSTSLLEVWAVHQELDVLAASLSRVFLTNLQNSNLCFNKFSEIIT